jgi:hypothetical protein
MFWGKELKTTQAALRTESILALGVLVGARPTLVGSGLAFFRLRGYIRGEISGAVLPVDQMSYRHD